MAGKRINTLREYHLLVVRGSKGFNWQIRYNRHANPIERGDPDYPTHEEALIAGEQALERVRNAVRKGAQTG